jgi:hypothetical protein
MAAARHITRAAFAALVLGSHAMGAQQAPTIRLSAPTAAPGETFTYVTGAVELAGSKLLIADGEENRLAIVDLVTGDSRNIGRVGAGPGEFGTTGLLLARPDGGVYVVDFIRRRLLPIASDGTFQNTIAFPAGLRVMRGIDRRGALYGDEHLPLTGVTLPDSMWIVRWDPSANRVDTLMKYNANASAVTAMQTGAYRAFAPRDSWAVLPTGDIMVVNATTYRVTIWNNGRMTRSATVPWEPARVTESEKTAIRREIAANPGRRAGPPASGRPPQVDVVFPETKPVLGGSNTGSVRPAPGGTVWIERIRSATDSIPRYDVLEGTSGALIARVLLTPRANVVGFGKGVVFVAERDADDVVSVRRYAMPALPGR